jgi:HPt (histidine-containing phosphotransfer) domain-containing protein
MNTDVSADAPATRNPLNQTLLDRYRARKNDLLQRLIEAYLEEAPKSFQSIRLAADGGHYGDLRLSAHMLKSSSYNLGATRLSKLCQDLEMAAISSDEAGVANLLKEIGPECFEVEQALHGELYQLRKPAPRAPAPRTPDHDDWL